MKMKTGFGQYCVNVLIGLDQFAHTFSGGSPDETISSRYGRLLLRYGSVRAIPWYRPIPKVVIPILDKIDPNHCVKAVEYDEERQSREEGLIDRDVWPTRGSVGIENQGEKQNRKGGQV
jgi:hypothetical protein